MSLAEDRCSAERKKQSVRRLLGPDISPPSIGWKIVVPVRGSSDGGTVGIQCTVECSNDTQWISEKGDERSSKD